MIGKKLLGRQNLKKWGAFAFQFGFPHSIFIYLIPFYVAPHLDFQREKLLFRPWL